MFGIFLIYLDEDNDKRLFEDIYYAYRKQMLTLAESILHSQDDAEDVVSMVFLRVVSKHWKLISRIQSDGDLRNYLLKATKNTALNMLNQNKRISASLDVDVDYNFDKKELLSDDAFLDMICVKMQYE